MIASNSKLFTTAAALDALGPAYVFETRFLMRGAVDRGVLHGDLGVIGAGDPQISGREYDGDPYGAFRPWAAALRERGIERITGDLYLAHGLFEPMEIHPEWPRDQLTDWYEAPIAALAFSDNCILVRVSPGAAGRRGGGGDGAAGADRPHRQRAPSPPPSAAAPASSWGAPATC